MRYDNNLCSFLTDTAVVLTKFLHLLEQNGEVSAMDSTAMLLSLAGLLPGSMPFNLGRPRDLSEESKGGVKRKKKTSQQMVRRKLLESELSITTYITFVYTRWTYGRILRITPSPTRTPAAR